MSVSTPGQPGALGRYWLNVNSNEDKICWYIELEGVTGEYSSPARTATHVHESAKGLSGPPRLAFPNPAPRGTRNGKEIRVSDGCMQGPFTTDTGTGFRVAQIEANPSGFNADTHTAQFTAGAVRGQLIPSERQVRRPKYFTSVLKTTATPDQVVDTSSNPAPGQKGAKGKFTISINTHENVLCYDVELSGVSGDYFKTATHVHFAAKGKAGPPRLSFKNPKKTWWGKRKSSTCIKGPFTTGLTGADGKDTSTESGFTLADLENNPTAFAADSHAVQFPAGAVRGQLQRVR